MRRVFVLVGLVAAGCGKPAPPLPAPVAPVPLPITTPARPAPFDPMAVVRKIEGALSSTETADWNALDAECTEAISKSSKADLLAARGAVRARLGRDDEALADLDKALRLAGDRHEWRRHRLPLFEKKEMWAELSLDLDFLIALDAKDRGLFLLRARARVASQEWARAVEDLNALVDHDPDSVELRLLRAKAASESGQRELAVADVTNVINRGATADLYCLRAEYQWRQRKEEQATADFDKAVGLDAKHARSLVGLADIHLRKDPVKALQFADRAVEAQPDMARAWFLRAHARLYNKDRDKAVGDFEKAWTLDPSMKELGVHLLSVPYEDLIRDRSEHMHKPHSHKDHDHNHKDHDHDKDH